MLIGLVFFCLGTLRSGVGEDDEICVCFVTLRSTILLGDVCVTGGGIVVDGSSNITSVGSLAAWLIS